MLEEGPRPLDSEPTTNILRQQQRPRHHLHPLLLPLPLLLHRRLVALQQHRVEQSHSHPRPLPILHPDDVRHDRPRRTLLHPVLLLLLLQ